MQNGAKSGRNGVFWAVFVAQRRNLIKLNLIKLEKMGAKSS